MPKQIRSLDTLLQEIDSLFEYKVSSVERYKIIHELNEFTLKLSEKGARMAIIEDESKSFDYDKLILNTIKETLTEFENIKYQIVDELVTTDKKIDSLTNIFSLDSLSLLELAMGIEEKLVIELPEDKFEIIVNTGTVQDLINIIKAKMIF